MRRTPHQRNAGLRKKLLQVAIVAAGCWTIDAAQTSSNHAAANHAAASTAAEREVAVFVPKRMRLVVKYARIKVA